MQLPWYVRVKHLPFSLPFVILHSNVLVISYTDSFRGRMMFTSRSIEETVTYFLDLCSLCAAVTEPYCKMVYLLVSRSREVLGKAQTYREWPPLRFSGLVVKDVDPAQWNMQVLLCADHLIDGGLPKTGSKNKVKLKDMCVCVICYLFTVLL